MTDHQASVGTQSIFHTLGIFVLVFFPFTAHSAMLSPSEIVNLWIQVYPNDLKAAVALTTDNFRKGQSEPQWIETRKKALAGSQLQYLGGNVISETLKGDSAVVVFQAHISSLVGEQILEEVYHLQKQPEGGWIIDAIKVTEEDPSGA